MIEFTAQMLRRVLALLALTGALTQNAPADLDAVRSSQFPWYASLTQAEGRFDDSIYLASNAVIFLEQHDESDGVLPCPYVLADLYIPDVHSLRAWYADDPSISGNEPSEIRDAVRAVNAAFAVSAASCLGAHLAFTLNAEPALALPLLAVKLAGGLLGALIAWGMTRRDPAGQAQDGSPCGAPSDAGHAAIR